MGGSKENGFAVVIVGRETKPLHEKVRKLSYSNKMSRGIVKKFQYLFY